MAYFLAIDIGTTSTKACAFTQKGELMHRERITYPTHNPEPGFQEQDPQILVQAIEQVVQDVLQHQQEQPIGIAFSCAMHSVIAVNAEGLPLTPCIIWADSRSTKYADELRQSPLGTDIYQHTGTPLHPMSPLCKITWLRDEMPAVFAKTAKFISIKEYLLHHWFGQYVVDYSIASATGLFDIENLDWYAPALDFAGITAEQLSKPVPPEHLLSTWQNDSRQQLGLKADVPVVVGASDGCLANLGEQVTGKGNLVISLGTSGAVRTTSTSKMVDEQQRIFNHILTEGQYVIGGPTNNGGIIFQWFSELLQQEPDELEQLEAAAAELPPGAKGLIFLPYLLGERAPVWNANARGAYLGLRREHGRAHLLRSLLEGVMFNLWHITQSFAGEEGVVQNIYANGGFTQSEPAMQILADVFGVPVHLQEHEESAAWGAAILGLKAIQNLDDWPDLPTADIKQVFQPNAKSHERYQSIFTLYCELSDKLLPDLEKIAILSG